MTNSLIDARGYFWWGNEIIPEQDFASPAMVTGALNIDTAGHTRLKLDMPLPRKSAGNRMSAIMDGQLEASSICGVLAGSGEYVRLMEIAANGGEFSSAAPSHEEIIARRCLVSRRPFSPSLEPRFTCLELGLAGYEGWLGLNSVHLKGKGRSIFVTYKRPRQQLWKIGAGRLVLSFDLRRPAPGRRFDVLLTETAGLKITPSASFDVDQAIALSGRIEDLMILLTDSNRGLDFPVLKSPRQKFPIRLFYPRLKRPDEHVQWHKCWTRFPQISESFGSIVQNWLDKHEQFGPGFHLYLGNRRGLQIYPEHRFASFIWGLESLHRRQFPAIPNSNLQAKISRILGQIAGEKDRDWAAGFLKNVGEPSLPTRLFKMLQSLPLDFNPLELNAFAENCTRRRNDISHAGGEREPGLYREFLDDVLKLNAALDLLYHARLLQEIGVSDEVLRWWFLDGFQSYLIRQTLSACGLTLPPSPVKPSQPLEPHNLNPLPA